MALDCYNDGVEYGKKSSDSYKQAGEHFAYLKSHMKHGEYKKWLEENDIKRATADFIIKVYERFLSNSSTSRNFEELSFGQLKELLSLSEGTESEFIEFVKNNQKDLSALSVRETRSLVKDYSSIGKETQVKKENLSGKDAKLTKIDESEIESKKNELESLNAKIESTKQKYDTTVEKYNKLVDELYVLEDEVILQELFANIYEQNKVLANFVNNEGIGAGVKSFMNHAYT